MAKLIIDSTKPITFREYLDICMVGELALKNEIANFFAKFMSHFPFLELSSLKITPKNKDDFNFTLDIIEKENKKKVSISGTIYKYNREFFDVSISTYALDYKYASNLAYFMEDKNMVALLKKLAYDKRQVNNLTKIFKINDNYFTLRLDEVYKKVITIYPYTNVLYHLDIESQIGEHNVYYYSPLKNLFYYDEAGLKVLPTKYQEKLTSLLPSLEMKELPVFVKDILEQESTEVYSTEEKMWSTKKPILITQLCYRVKKGYELDIPEKEHLVSNSSINTYLVKEEENTLENTYQIVNSIKSMLTNLKEKEVPIDSKLKVKIRNSAFFSSITEDKKEIDSFFKDPTIIKYCDLSLIDFTNADIENMDLSNTNASINLKKVYHQSIKNTNLKNINLIGQDLEGILADNADLRETNVFVPVDKASIVGTKFSSSSTFMLGTQILTMEEASNMGFHIENEPNDSLKKILKL